MGQAFAGTLIPYSINISCLTFVLLNCDESVMKIGTGGGGGIGRIVLYTLCGVDVRYISWKE